MKSTLIALSLISLTFLPFVSEAKTLSLLGERLSSCKNLANDDFIVEYPSSTKAQAQSMMENDRLRSAIVAKPDCFRVGTEIQLYLGNETIPYMGRALIKEIRVLSSSALLKDKSHDFSSTSVRTFVKNNKAKQYGVIHFEVMEKVEETFVNEEYQRLPTCFPAYGDWKSMRLKKDQEHMVKKIQNNRTKAIIWNGTLNCYKVGVYTEIQVEKRSEGSLGYIIPTELHLVHYTNLTSKHAKILGENLSSLRKRMAEKKEIDGGYTTMVVFDYEKVHPKDLEQKLQ